MNMYEILWSDSVGVKHYIRYKTKKSVLAAIKNTKHYNMDCLIDYNEGKLYYKDCMEEFYA